MDASSVRRKKGGGSTCAGARSAAISDAATSRWESMQPRIFARPVTRSLRASSPARHGSTATSPGILPRVHISRRRDHIPKTNRCPARAAGFRTTGKQSSADREQIIAMGSSKKKSDAIYEWRHAAEKKALAEKAV